MKNIQFFFITFYIYTRTEEEKKCINFSICFSSIL